MSRTISASPRNRGPRASRRLYGSRASSARVAAHECRSIDQFSVEPGIGLLPVGHRRPPVAEHGRDLGGGPLLPGYHQDLTDTGWDWVGDGVRGTRDRQPEPAEVVALVVVAVPAAVILSQVERQDRAAREGNRFLDREDRLARHVSPAGPGIDAPGGLVLVVDREADRPGHPLLTA